MEIHNTFAVFGDAIFGIIVLSWDIKTAFDFLISMVGRTEIYSTTVFSDKIS